VERLPEHTMDVRHLLILHEVAKCGSITRAASALHTSQPALTRALQILEHRVGLTLLERTRRGTTLTPAGEALDRHTRAILAELRRAEDEMASHRDVGAGRIAVGTMPAGTSSLIPEAVLRFQRVMPNVMVSIFESTGPMPELVERGELDLAVMSLPAETMRTNLVEETLLYDRLVVVARRGHPLLRRSRITASELAEADWLLPTQIGKPREEFENAFWQLGIEPPRRKTEIGSARTLRALLLASDKIAPMVRLSIIEEERRGLLAVVPVDLDLPIRRVSVVLRRSTARPPAIDLFLSALRAAAAELKQQSMAPRPRRARRSSASDSHAQRA
jgi:DNA-binding transcriptional LysR family regulator